MTADPISPTVRRCFIWTGPVLIVLATVTIVGVMRLVPPPRPAWSAEQIADVYRSGQTNILIGCFVFITATVLMLTWASVLIAQCRRVEGPFPFLTYAQLMFAACCFMVAMLIGMTWAAASFRPDDISPEITRSLNDVAWFLFLYTWPPFSAWFVVIAVTVFSDKSETPMYPRWVAYFNLWCALLTVPAGLMAFFKSGPFAYDGLIAMYIPFGIFFVWMIAMTVQMFKVQARDEKVGASAATRPDSAITTTR
jgi:hypothetical protein